MVKYIPQRADVVWLDFSPHAGHEQAGRRPGLVMSPRYYNRNGMLLICPITNKEKGYPFEVPIEAGAIKGFVLADHIKHQDGRARKMEFAARADGYVMDAVRTIIFSLLAK